MDINKKNRSDLKSYFVKNSIPTESNFAELIEGMLNQKDDGIVKLSGDPLSIEAAGDLAGLQKVINFYAKFQDANPSWSLQLNPRTDPNVPATAKAGFCVADGQSVPRLFIDKTTGNLGVGTINPQARLTVVGAANINDGNGWANANGKMASGSLTIGSVSASYGGGSDWTSNTAGLLFETKANTEIAVHDANTRLASLMYYEGEGINRITIGRNMGGGGPNGKVSTPVIIADNLTVNGTITPSAGNTETNGILFPKNPGGGGADAAWLRYYARGGESCTLEIGTSNDADDHIALMPSGGVGIGINTPIAKLDIVQSVRTGTHPAAIKGLYITGDFGEAEGVEFRHNNATQGIGFGYNTIYAAGSNANQDLQLKPKGTGDLRILGAANISNGNGYANANNYMSSGSLTIGSTNSNYGGGTSWNANTAGLLLETQTNTEIAVHDSGTRVASLMYYQGDAVNKITIGRDMGWGVSPVNIAGDITLNGNVALGGFTDADADEWPKFTWYRDLADNWDEGLIKHGSSRGFFGRTGFGIHLHSSRDWTFFSTGWDPLVGIEGGTGNTKIKGILTIGDQKVVSGMSGTGLLALKGSSPQIDFIDSDHNDWSIHVNSNKMYFIRQPWSFTDLVLDGAGHVGIGTDNPTQAKLVVLGSAALPLNGYGYLNRNGASATNTTFTSPYSIFTDQRIAGSEFNAHSDERIKNIQSRSDSATDLQTLLGIEITDYHYKDVIGKGNAPYKKVVAQQVEQVFPQAVSKHTDVVPDIYQQASFTDGWVELATDLKEGERVRLISDKVEGVYEVLEVTKDKFRTDFDLEGDKVFVYGREVNDFGNVDYDAIAMLNVSATQQIKKEMDAVLNALKAENAALNARLDALEAKTHY